MLAVLVIVFNLLADIGQRYADPRVREAGAHERRTPRRRCELVVSRTGRRGRDVARASERQPACARRSIITLVFVVVGLVGAVIVLVPSLNHLYLDQDLLATLKPPLHARAICSAPTTSAATSPGASSPAPASPCSSASP